MGLVHLRRRWPAAWLLSLLAPVASLAAVDCLDQSEAEGRPIRAFTVNSRWNSLGGVQFPVALGSRYTAEAASLAMNAVRQRLAEDNLAEAQTGGYIGVRFIEACPIATPDGGLDVLIRVIEARLPYKDPLSGLLPVPRSNLPSLLKEAPPAFLLFNPEIGVTQDRAMGAAQTLKLQTDLLSARGILSGAPPERPSWTLPVAVEGRRSFDKNAYEGLASFAAGHEAPLRILQRFDFHADFQSSRTPQGEATLLRNLARAGASLRWKPRAGPVRQFTLAPAFRFANNRRLSDRLNDRLEEKAFQVVGVADVATSLGPLRWAFLLDRASPEERVAYRRASTLLGWNGQIPLSSKHTNQTLGVEVVIGAGRVWGHAPQYARYFAGNNSVDFLTTPADSPRLAWALTVPRLRSFGQSQATTGAGGATAFWNFNLNLAIPLPPFSFPLIPRDEAAAGVPINELVYRNGTGSARSFLESYFENIEGKPAGEARRLAEADIRRIEPAMRFITRRANLYSVKPLFLFDAARLAVSGASVGRTVNAMGGGLQLTLVVARFEAGYLWTLDRRPGDSPGNFVLRLAIENLF